MSELLIPNLVLVPLVGRSNVITGIAKMIKVHFEKHPLVIVNVKGRAKGTSVKELVFGLEVSIPTLFSFNHHDEALFY